MRADDLNPRIFLSHGKLYNYVLIHVGYKCGQACVNTCMSLRNILCKFQDGLCKDACPV